MPYFSSFRGLIINKRVTEYKISGFRQLAEGKFFRILFSDLLLILTMRIDVNDVKLVMYTLLKMAG